MDGADLRNVAGEGINVGVESFYAREKVGR